VELIGKNQSAVTKTLLDSGATGNLINTQFTKKHHMNIQKLEQSIPVYNIDNTENCNGKIEYFNIVLGTDWLHEHNPEIKWQNFNLKFTRCPDTCHIQGLCTVHAKLSD
ncbi:hypothetical protein JAAARDRAFT_129556, partial [Jaapia argillacea MUCL 33604]